MTDLGELRCVEFRDLFSILPGPLAVLTVGALVGCMQCAHATLHIRLLGGDNNNNYYCCLLSLYSLLQGLIFFIFQISAVTR